MGKPKPKTDPNAYTPISDAHLDFWAGQEIGGSGLSLSIQRDLRNMAIELIRLRTLAKADAARLNDQSWELEAYHEKLRDEFVGDGQWPQ